ncbi:MAG: TonB-dependent receptor [Prevotellaceae bacterium]|jgi:iron complex outermembrane receptor protein|nr:TonB-dependent receptor [Prevotellaceae bacterium]
MKKLKQRSNFIFCFNHWTRKPYAAFNSMKKCFKMGVVSVCYAMIALASQDVFAQTDTLIMNKTVILDEASVMVIRQQVYSEMARIVTVINKDEIKKMPVRTLQDLLENISSIDVRNRGGEGVQADVSIRGGTFDQVLILLNGINITDPQTGHHNLNIPVDLASIDRIEVLQGPGSRILGPNAFSGAINIITGKANTNNIQLKLTGGQHAYLAPLATANLHRNNFGAYATVSHSQSDGYISNTDFKITNYYLQTYYSKENLGNFEFQGSFQNKAFGSNGFYSPAYPDQFEQLHTFFASLKWKKQFSKLNIETATYWRRNYDCYELIRDSALGRNFHRTDVQGIQACLSYLSIIGKTIVGTSYRHEEVLSTSLGKPLSKPHNTGFYSKVSSRPQYVNGDARDIIDYYIDHTVYLSKFSLSTGILGSWSSAYDNNIYAGVDASYRLSANTKLYAGVNQSLRLPTYTELYYKNAGYIGNSDIKPEKAITYEGGIKYSQYYFSSYLSIFYRRGENIIDWIKLNEEDDWKSRNLTHVNALGIEVSGSYTPQNSWVKKLQLSAMWQDLNKDASNYISKYVLDYLKYKINAGIDHNIFIPKLIACWRFSYQNREGSYADFKLKTEVPYKAFAIVNLKLMYSEPGYNVFVDISNLFNKSYVDISNLEQARFWLKAGMQITIF